MAEQRRESIATTGLRALVRVVFGMVGLGVGILLLGVITGGFSEATGTFAPPTPDHDLEILPNAEGKRKVASRTAPVILVVDIVGVMGTERLNATTLREQLLESREGVLKGSRVKGIILNINSPGGTLNDINGMYDAIVEYKKQYDIPIYAFVDGVALSGGMYVAVAADKIYTTSTSLVGSIGVVMPPMMNFSGTLDKLGVTAVTVSAGTGKDLMNPTRPWAPDEQAPLQAITNFFYDQFVDIIVSQRKGVDRDVLVNEIGAGFFPAQKGVEYGLVDTADASKRGVIQQMLKEIGIKDKNYQVVGMKRRFGFLEGILDGKSPLFTGKMKHQLDLFPGIDPELLTQPLALHLPNLR